jgi:hypothetical protein
VDYRRQQRESTPPSTSTGPQWSGSQASSLSPCISLDLKWSFHRDRVVKCNSAPSSSEGQRNLSWPLRPLRTSTDVALRTSYGVVITTWYGTVRNRRALQRVVRSAQRIIRGTLPALQDIYSTSVTGSPRRSLRTSAMACSPRYHSRTMILHINWDQETASISKPSDC